MPIQLAILMSVLGATVVVVLAIRGRGRGVRWTVAEAERIREIRDAIGEASVLKDVDPWGEVAATHYAKLTGEFKQFSARVHRAGGDPLQVRSVGARLYLDCLELLQGVSVLLHELTLADPAYYRDIMQTGDSVGAEEYRNALIELAVIQGLEERIQGELSKTETAIVAFHEALKLLQQKRDPSAVLSAAIEKLK